MVRPEKTAKGIVIGSAIAALFWTAFAMPEHHRIMHEMRKAVHEAQSIEHRAAEHDDI